MVKKFKDYHHLADFVVGEIKKFREEYEMMVFQLKRLENQNEMLFEALVEQQEKIVKIETELGIYQHQKHAKK
jgi:hypothetical protein